MLAHYGNASHFNFLQAVHGVVYVAYAASTTCTDTVDALQANDGRLLWRYQVENQHIHTMVVCADVVYLGISFLTAGSLAMQSKVEALRVANGKLLRRHSSADSSVVDQLEVTHALLYLVTAKVLDEESHEALATIHTLRAGDGSEVWRVIYKTGALSITATATSSVLYVLIPVEHYAGYEIDALRTSDGVLLWRSKSDVVTGVFRKAVAKDLLYLYQPGRLAAFSTTDGKLRWCADDIHDVALQASPDVIYTGGMQQVCALQADNGKKLWSVEYHPNLGSTIIASDAVVYVASSFAGTLYALRKSDGGKLWYRGFDHCVFALALEE